MLISKATMVSWTLFSLLLTWGTTPTWSCPIKIRISLLLTGGFVYPSQNRCGYISWSHLSFSRTINRDTCTKFPDNKSSNHFLSFSSAKHRQINPLQRYNVISYLDWMWGRSSREFLYLYERWDEVLQLHNKKVYIVSDSFPSHVPQRKSKFLNETPQSYSDQ